MRYVGLPKNFIHDDDILWGPAFVFLASLLHECTNVYVRSHPSIPDVGFVPATPPKSKKQRCQCLAKLLHLLKTLKQMCLDFVVYANEDLFYDFGFELFLLALLICMSVSSYAARVRHLFCRFLCFCADWEEADPHEKGASVGPAHFALRGVRHPLLVRARYALL